MEQFRTRLDRDAQQPNALQEGVARGEFVAVNPEETAALLIAVYDGLVLQWLADPQSVNWPTISQTFTRVLLHGLLNSAENPAFNRFWFWLAKTFPALLTH